MYLLQWQGRSRFRAPGTNLDPMFVYGLTHCLDASIQGLGDWLFGQDHRDITCWRNFPPVTLA